MAVRTSESHGGDAVDKRDFYRRIIESSSSPDSAKSAQGMIRLIDHLDAEFPVTDIWLLTSHNHLVLMDAPTYDGGEWLVTIQGILGAEHLLSYAMPARESAFSQPAEVHTSAMEIEQAIEFIKIAMRSSGGWPGSPELGLRN